MLTLEYVLLIGSALILLSIFIAKISDNLGVPTLILFLGVGMLAGSDGLGGIYFDNANLAQSIGMTALIFILFAGGLETDWNSVKPILWQALSLSTFGVAITAFVMGIAAYYILGLPWIACLLLGSIISSTDAAAVFSVLRAKNTGLTDKMRTLLEFESGSNDPMAIFLTIGMIQLIVNPESSYFDITMLLFTQFVIGVILGLTLGKLMVWIIGKLNISYQGIYLVYGLAFACMVYGLTTVLGGSGILAVYISGIVIGRKDFVQKRSMLRFFDGLAWLGQIGMFLTLGLLVFPSRLIPLIGIGLLLSFILMFVARPISVFISLAFVKLGWRQKTFISWVGLRGSVPIILATFPLVYGVPNADIFFSLIFFIVLTSALLQGWSLSPVAKFLKVSVPVPKQRKNLLEFSTAEGIDAEMVDFYVGHKSGLIGKSIVDLHLPKDSLVVLINRNEGYVVPSGGTVIEQGDILLTLVNPGNIEMIKEIMAK
jgi:cell volume regulation protein A